MNAVLERARQATRLEIERAIADYLQLVVEVDEDRYEGLPEAVTAVCERAGKTLDDLNEAIDRRKERRQQLATYAAQKQASDRQAAIERELRTSAAKVEAEQRRHAALVNQFQGEKESLEKQIRRAGEAERWLLANMPDHLRAEVDAIVEQRKQLAPIVKATGDELRHYWPAQRAPRAQEFEAAEKSFQQFERRTVAFSSTEEARRNRELAEKRLNDARIALQRIDTQIAACQARHDDAQKRLNELQTAIDAIQARALVEV